MRVGERRRRDGRRGIVGGRIGRAGAADGADGALAPEPLLRGGRAARLPGSGAFRDLILVKWHAGSVPDEDPYRPSTN
jgi:hypothetical protein